MRPSSCAPHRFGRSVSPPQKNPSKGVSRCGSERSPGAVGSGSSLQPRPTRACRRYPSPCAPERIVARPRRVCQRHATRHAALRAPAPGPFRAAAQGATSMLRGSVAPRPMSHRNGSVECPWLRPADFRVATACAAAGPPPPRGRRSRVRGGRATPHQRIRLLSITPCSAASSFVASRLVASRLTSKPGPPGIAESSRQPMR